MIGPTLMLLRGHWRIAAAAVLIALLVMQSLRLAHEQRDHARTRDAAARQVADYHTAYSRAVADAYAAKARKEADHEAARTASANAFAHLARRYRAAIMQRAADRAGPAAARRADLPGNADAARLSGHPAQGAAVPDDAFSISGNDARICADNTAYAQAAHQWAVRTMHPD